MEQKRDNLSQQNLVEIVGTTVLMESKYENENITTIGTGFFIEPDKIVTNIHVLAGATSVTPKNVDTEAIYTVEGITAFDDINDLVILKIAEDGTPFPIGDSNKVRKGDRVCLIGCPDGKVDYVEGTVDDIRNSGKHLWLKFKHSAGPGYSGSAILNAKGEVIGVIQSGDLPVEDSESISGRAVSTSVLKLLLEETKEVEQLDVWQKRSRIRAYIESYIGTDYRLQGEYKKAVTHYDTALELNPDRADVYRDRGIVNSALGKSDAAFADFLTSLRLNRERFSFSAFGIFLSWRLRFIKTYTKRIIHILIRFFLDKGNWLAIQGKMEFLVGKTRIDQGNVSEARKHYIRGINHFTESIHHGPKRAKTYYERGRSRHIFGQFETTQENTTKAKRLYEQTVKDINEALRLKSEGDKFQLACYNTRAEAKEALGDLEEAITDYGKIIQMSPKNNEAYYTRGYLRHKLGDYEGAIDDYNNSRQLDSKNAIVSNNSGLCKKALGDLEGAIEDFTNTIQLNPEYANAYFNRGLVKKSLDNIESAIDDYDNAIKLNPKHWGAYNNRGNAKKALGDLEGAIEDYDMAIKLNPEDVEAYNNRGKAKEKLGQQEAAEADFAKAKELDPEIEK